MKKTQLLKKTSVPKSSLEFIQILAFFCLFCISGVNTMGALNGKLPIWGTLQLANVDFELKLCRTENMFITAIRLEGLPYFCKGF